MALKSGSSVYLVVSTTKRDARAHGVSGGKNQILMIQSVSG